MWVLLELNSERGRQETREREKEGVTCYKDPQLGSGDAVVMWHAHVGYHKLITF